MKNKSEVFSVILSLAALCFLIAAIVQLIWMKSYLPGGINFLAGVFAGAAGIHYLNKNKE